MRNRPPDRPFLRAILTPFLVLAFLALCIGIALPREGKVSAAENELTITAMSCTQVSVAWNDIVDDAGNKLLTVRANTNVVFSQELTDAVGVDDDATFEITVPTSAVVNATVAPSSDPTALLDEDTITLPACPTPVTPSPTPTATVGPTTAKLTVVKDTNPPTDAVFSRFSLARDMSRTFDLEDDESISFDVPAPGRFILTEDSPASGWQLDDIRCRFTVSGLTLPLINYAAFLDPRVDLGLRGAVYDLPLRRAFLFLLPGDQVICEFTNERVQPTATPTNTATPLPTATPVPPAATPIPATAVPPVIVTPAEPAPIFRLCNNGLVVNLTNGENCPVQVTPSAPTQVPASPPVGNGTIRPPSTGDAGLASAKFMRSTNSCGWGDWENQGYWEDRGYWQYQWWPGDNGEVWESWVWESNWVWIDNWVFVPWC